MRSSRCSAPVPPAVRRSVGPGRRTIAAWHPSRIRVRRGHLRRTSSPTNARPPRSWRCCARHGSWIPPAQVLCCWTRASIWASVSSFYRLLRFHGEVRERRRQATHPARVRPSSPADRWSSGRGTSRNSKVRPAVADYYDLYVVLDNFSSYAAGAAAPVRVSSPRNSSPTRSRVIWETARPVAHPRRSAAP